MQARHGREEGVRQRLRSFAAESELEILPSVSKTSLLFHCTQVTPKDVLSRKLHRLLLTWGDRERFFRFLASTGRERSLKPCRPRLFTWWQQLPWCRAVVPVWLLWPHSCLPDSKQWSTRKVLGISDSQWDRKSQAGPPFLPALPTSWVAEPQATTSREA